MVHTSQHATLNGEVCAIAIGPLVTRIRSRVAARPYVPIEIKVGEFRLTADFQFLTVVESPRS
jgi:hypothetical protein